MSTSGANARKSLDQHFWKRFCRLWSQDQKVIKSTFLISILPTSGAKARDIKSILLGSILSTSEAKANGIAFVDFWSKARKSWNQYFWDRFCRLPGKLHGFAVKITLFWSSKNHYVLLHKRLGSKLVPGKLHGFDMKISFSWSSNNHCVLLHKRLGSKILPGKLNGFAMKIILFWSSKYDCVLLHKTRVKTNSRKTPWFCFENHSLLKFWNHCVLLHKRLGSNIFPGKVNGCAMKITLFWSSKNRCAFLHKRLGSKLVPRKRNGFAIKITFFEALKPLHFITHETLVKNSSRFCYENYPLLKCWKTLRFYYRKDSAQK